MSFSHYERVLLGHYQSYEGKLKPSMHESLVSVLGQGHIPNLKKTLKMISELVIDAYADQLSKLFAFESDYHQGDLLLLRDEFTVENLVFNFLGHEEVYSSFFDHVKSGAPFELLDTCYGTYNNEKILYGYIGVDGLDEGILLDLRYFRKK